MKRKYIIWTLFCALFLVGSAQAAKSPEEKLARKSGCFKCHAISKKKDGPPYKEIAEKYKAKENSEQALYEHLTSSPMIEIEGKEQEHKQLKTDDEAEIKAVVKWILDI
jgi:cytochrome c